MQISDPEMGTAVWARVYDRPDSTNGLLARLARWIVNCHQMAVRYYDLARMAPRNAPALRQLAQACAGEGAELAALYVTLSHVQPPKPTVFGTLETDPKALFAELYRRETDMACELMDACMDGAHDTVLQRQAERQRNRAADLLEISARYL